MFFTLAMRLFRSFCAMGWDSDRRRLGLRLRLGGFVLRRGRLVLGCDAVGGGLVERLALLVEVVAEVVRELLHELVDPALNLVVPLARRDLLPEVLLLGAETERQLLQE